MRLDNRHPIPDFVESFRRAIDGSGAQPRGVVQLALERHATVAQSVRRAGRPYQIDEESRAHASSNPLRLNVNVVLVDHDISCPEGLDIEESSVGDLGRIEQSYDFGVLRPKDHARCERPLC